MKAALYNTIGARIMQVQFIERNYGRQRFKDDETPDEQPEQLE